MRHNYASEVPLYDTPDSPDHERIYTPWLFQLLIMRGQIYQKITFPLFLVTFDHDERKSYKNIISPSQSRGENIREVYINLSGLMTIEVRKSKRINSPLQSHDPWTGGEKQEYMRNSYSSLPPHHMLWGVTYTLGSFPRHPFPPGEPGARYTPGDKLPLTLSHSSGLFRMQYCFVSLFCCFPYFWGEGEREREKYS